MHPVIEIPGFLACCVAVMLGAGAVKSGLESAQASRDIALGHQKAYFSAVDLAKRHMIVATSMRFDKVCTFNGHVVDGEWLRNDLRPCLERGKLRIWRNEYTSRSGTFTHFTVGNVGSNGSVREVLTYTPNGSTISAGSWGGFEQMAAEISPVAKLLQEAFPANDPVEANMKVTTDGN